MNIAALKLFTMTPALHGIGGRTSPPTEKREKQREKQGMHDTQKMGSWRGGGWKRDWTISPQYCVLFQKLPRAMQSANGTCPDSIRFVLRNSSMS